MKKILVLISFLLICLTPFIVKAWTTLGVGQTVAGGSSCTDLSQTSSDDYWGAGLDNFCQGIKYESGCTVGSVTVEAYTGTSSYNAHIEMWTTEDKSTGSQIGGDSDTQSISATAGGTFYTFTWTSNKPTPTGDYFLHFVSASAADRVRCHSNEALYEGSGYVVWRGVNGSVAKIAGDHVMAFTVDYD